MFRLRRICFSSISEGMIWNHSHFHFLSVSSSVSLPYSFLLSLFKHLSSVFSLQALCALWCWFLQLSTHQSCHLSFIDASSEEHIRNVTISVWLIVIACVTPLMSLDPGLPGACVWAGVFTLPLPASLVKYHFVYTNTLPHILVLTVNVW